MSSRQGKWSPGDYFPKTQGGIRRLDRLVWRRQRRQHVRSRRRRLASEIREFELHAPHGYPQGNARLLLVPHDGPDSGHWGPAKGNISYEAYQSAVELLGVENVVLFPVAWGEEEESWQPRLLKALLASRATHLWIQIERDPNKAPEWSWDVIASILGDNWDGTVIAQMYDAGFEWLRLRAQLIAELMPRTLIVDLAEPMVGYAKPDQFEVGPITMPISNESLQKINDALEDCEKRFDVSFIGTLYDNRVEQVNALRSSGLSVAVNPHREDNPSNYAETRANQPDYLDFLRGLAQSELTVNFAEASSEARWHYKIRIQEAAMVGCLPVTNDVNRTERFFAPDEYAQFDRANSLSDVLSGLLSDRDALKSAQKRLRNRAQALAKIDYWKTVNSGLLCRGLPVLREIAEESPRYRVYPSAPSTEQTSIPASSSAVDGPP